MTVLETEKFRCKFCVEWSEVDPADQAAPADFCHPEDHVGLLTHDVVIDLTMRRKRKPPT